MFGFNHLPELLILLVIALVVFGPKRLPEIGGAMGKSIREFRKGTSDLMDGDKQDDPAPQAQITQTPTSTPTSGPKPEPASEATPTSGQARDAR